MTEFENYLEREIEDLQGQSGASMAATAFTTEEMPDPIRGGDATMTVLVFPEDQPVMAAKLEGDEYPRWLLLSDPYDSVLYLSNGATSPYDSRASIGWINNQLSLGSVLFNHDAEFNVPEDGVILKAPNNTRYRIKVANDGTLTTEAVT